MLPKPFHSHSWPRRGSRLNTHSVAKFSFNLGEEKTVCFAAGSLGASSTPPDSVSILKQRNSPFKIKVTEKLLVSAGREKKLCNLATVAGFQNA